MSLSQAIKFGITNRGNQSKKKPYAKYRANFNVGSI